MNTWIKESVMKEWMQEWKKNKPFNTRSFTLSGLLTRSRETVWLHWFRTSRNWDVWDRPLVHPLTHSVAPHCSLRSRAPLHLLARSTALTSSLTCSLFSFGWSAVKKNHLIFLFQTVELIPDWSFLSRLLILPVIGCEKVEILISCQRQIPLTMAKKNPKKLYIDS